MNLIFIYGPPATGKLTVATELAKATGYVLFHNHLTLNLAREVFPDFDDKLFELTHVIRLDMFAAAAKYERNLIFTNVFSGDEVDTEFIHNVVSTVEKNGGNVLFVQLTAPLDVLISRVGDDSRKAHRKISNEENLRQMLETFDINVSVPYENVLKIDTSVLTPQESSQRIIDTFLI